MSILVLPTSPVLDAFAAALVRLAPGETVWTDPGAARPDAVEAIVAFRLAPGVAPRFPRLRFVASPGAGADDVLATPDLAPHVPVTRADDARQGQRMAQHVALAVLRWHRDAARYADAQRERAWTRRLVEPEEAWTVGLMGFGRQGRAIATTLETMGYPLRTWTRTAPAAAPFPAFAGRDGLAPFLAGTRVLVCALPLTDQTRGLVDAALLARLPPQAYFVDVSRGGVAVDADVHAAVRDGALAGAALDVFEREPLPADSPLWGDGRIVVTPHVAALPRVEVAARQVLDNLARARRGEPLAHVVDRRRGY